MLTRILCLGNIMVESSNARRAPYWHLIETDFHSPRYTAHLTAVLKTAADRMGLDRFPDLFEAYATQIAHSIRQSSYESMRLSPVILGYSSLKEFAEASFPAFSPANLSVEDSNADALAHGRNLFLNHCKAIQKSEAEGIMICFGDIVGECAVSWIDAHIDEESFDELEQLLRRTLAGLGSEREMDAAMVQYTDEIVVATLRTLGDLDFTQNGSIVRALLASGPASNKRAVQAFQTMTKYRRLEDFVIHTPNLPAFGTRTILRSLEWVTTRSQVDLPALIYHVLHQMFAEVQKACLVNEQLRLLNALTLWVACQHEHFADVTLLRTLVNGATALLSQLDLVPTAQSLLEWSFTVYRGLHEEIASVPGNLIRISSTIHGYCCSAEIDFVPTGHALAAWIDHEMLTLCETSKIREQIVKKALPAWCLEPSSQLAAMADTVTSKDLSDVLKDYRISHNKFHLVRKMRDLAEVESSASTRFATSDFWRLKECIPATEHLQPRDVQAFAELLVRQHGHIESLGKVGTEQSASHSIRTRHKRASRGAREALPVPEMTRKPILAVLLGALDSLDDSPAPSTYRTLRYLVAELAATETDFKSWPLEQRFELRFIASLPRNPPVPSTARLSDLLDLEAYAATGNFERWISSVSALLANVLSSYDLFFAPLAAYLHVHPVFAEDLLPVLVHSLLCYHTTSGRGEDARDIVSRYLTSVAQTDGAHPSCLRAVVDVVLHLRSFAPPRTSSPLAYDQWLAVDYGLLSRVSITCGAFTTALLFLELKAEYASDSGADSSDSEQDYYNIYSHIEEPDGFYGIKSKDLLQFLVRRFRHENEWDKAFRFHGAALEAGWTETSAEDGMRSSLHAFGFNRLAMNALQHGGSQDDEADSRPRLNYELGWRTATWDLPDAPGAADDSASLYFAMRSVHRERNGDAIQSAIQTAFMTEMSRLRELGNENVAGVRQVVRSMMCIQQVAEWHSARQERAPTQAVWVEPTGSVSDPKFECVRMVSSTCRELMHRQ
jgi:ataxia telangiectasia mutated family protein